MRQQERDYNCVYVTTAEEMQPLFEPVREFLAKVGNLIKEYTLEEAKNWADI